MPGRILIADDDVDMLELLEHLVAQRGYDVVCARNGREAWDALRQPDSPQLAVMDWSMPELSGVEVCRRLRESRPRACYTYVILLTAQAEQKAVSTAFEAGVDDYLVKPVDSTLLFHRIQVGRRVASYEAALASRQAELERYATQMHELAESRARQLAHADRMATLGLLAAGVAHEINNPTTFISGNLRILRDCWPAMEDSLRTGMAREPEQAGRLRFMLEEVPKIHAAIASGAERILKIVNSLKSYARQDKEVDEPFDVNRCVQDALALCANALKYHVTVDTRLADGLPPVSGDAQQIDQVLVNLFINAADAIAPQGKGALRVVTALVGRDVRLTVEDSGPGLPPNVIGQIWDPFFTTKPPGKGTGLGLSIVQRIIENHGGTIVAENQAAGGARFVITLPWGHAEAAGTPPPEVGAGQERRSIHECATADCR